MKVESYYASPERKKIDQILKSHDEIIEIPFLRSILNLLPHLLFLLNQQRQIVFSNETMVEYLSLKDYQEILGLRPGELFKCVNSTKMEAGCGTSRACRYCGAVNALIEAQNTNSPSRHKCRIVCKDEKNQIGYKNLQIDVYPYGNNENRYFFFFMQDISEKRRLENLKLSFLHDLSNLVSALLGRVELFPKTGLQSEQVKEIGEIKKITQYISEEIHAQREISKISDNKLKKQETPVDSMNTVVECVNFIRERFRLENERIEIDPNSQKITFSGDKKKLNRILVNLLKNAIEASKETDTIKIGTSIRKDKVSFWVFNPGYIPPEIKHQMFQFGFTTKGEGRGIGLYSVKVLTEQVLGGKVRCSTSKSTGTTFTICLPIY